MGGGLLPSCIPGNPLIIITYGVQVNPTFLAVRLIDESVMIPGFVYH